MKRLARLVLILVAVGVNVALAAAHLRAETAGRACPGWRACQCYDGDDPEGCCAVCTDSCNGCKVTPAPDPPKPVG